MTGRLEGKRALVTAAGQGIGRAIAESFAAEGAHVFATDLEPDKLSDLEGASVHRLDVRDQAAIAELAREIAPIDVLANIAGFVHHGTVLECADADWDFSFDLNVKSMHRMIRAFLPPMLEAGGGSIINMSSAASSLKGAPARYAYGASKAAIIGLTKSVAADFIGKNVRCNAICPGTVQSPSWRERVENLGREMGDKQKALDMFIARQPMGRVGEAAEVAALAVYLASDESAFTTGTAIPIDGGWTL